MALPREIFTSAQVRQLEAAAISAGTPGYALMQRAGAAAFAVLRERWPLARALIVVAGPGNNGGDGLVLARLAHQAGLDVEVQLVADAAKLYGEAREALDALFTTGLKPQHFDPAALRRADVIVDALLGIGARGPMRESMREAIDAINASGRRVLALDLPSGLDPDTGHALPAVCASVTLCFLALKQGLFLGEGPEHAGEVLFDGLQVARAQLEPSLRRLTYESLAEVMPPRPRQSHKGLFGRVLVVGGGRGMPGAVRLAAETSLRVGAGLVTAASRPEHLAAITASRPELMFHAIEDSEDIAPAMAAADVIAVGPGLGQDEWARGVLGAVLANRRPGQRLVADADALNLIAAAGDAHRFDDWVLTPHPGEAGRLLGISASEVQQDRLAVLRGLCARHGGVVVLKGAGTLIGTEGEAPCLCDHGNPGMAAPGMGDVLTGAVAGFLAQSTRTFEATAAAVYAHAVAGDRCARAGLRGILALDVAQELRAVLAQLP
jgi:NAD(P)H-hydrate epimerase